MNEEARALWREESRELLLACDALGLVVWADERAARLLGARPGMALARLAAARCRGDDVALTVSDTGIGIAPQHFDLVFEEFGQIDGPLQRKVKGNGLGLSLSRRLAELLGGSLTLDSELGRGSTFTLTIPLVHPEVRELLVLSAQPLDPSRAPILIVEDDRARYLMRKILEKSPYQLVEAKSGPEGVKLARVLGPDVIFLDFLLRDVTAFDVLDDLKADPRTGDIPVVIVTSHDLDPSERQRLSAETEAILSKESLSRELAIHRIRDARRKAGVGTPSSTE
jgi:CheY-like chemotaxis protein